MTMGPLENKDHRTLRVGANIQITGASLDGITYFSLVKFLLKLTAAAIPVWIAWAVTLILLSTWFAGLQRLFSDLRTRF